MTTIVNTEKMEKLKAIALKETKTIKEVMEEVMDLAIEAYEKKHGELNPSDHRGDASKLFK